MTMKINTPILLIGFMGAGKTTIGKALAKKYHYSFIDLDAYIEMTSKKTIPQIFEENGEQGFRKLEFHCLKEALLSYDLIATGGGILTEDETYQFIRDKKVSAIWLDAPFEKLYKRIQGDANRPNANKKSFEFLNHLYSERVSRYNEIAFIKVSTAHSMEATLSDIQDQMLANDQY
ncbi:shikimate kinase [Staphylococcus lutrae]|uniref:Shikimate kinase n=1 Tax=Staphylococcus lutrae TaxID=155085 RepID=A0AAC9WI74_9STAP|nr:shikimate kinase [Staphylococcus lutrae]ARJ49844.1 shikimate kinase [Staphylococcus lutrae]PNZ37793.1 shikimate kinase [Staphylococcus lutrae]